MVRSVQDARARFAGKAQVYKVDVDQSADLANRYGIRSVPTLMVFEGGKPVRTAMGAQPKHKLLELIG